MTALETYLAALRDIRSSGEAVDETSYYPALSNFLDEVGKTLKPKVRCILQLKNRGAGSPDGGLFTEDQLKKRSKHDAPDLPQMPARGAAEWRDLSSIVASSPAYVEPTVPFAHGVYPDLFCRGVPVFL